MKNNINENNIQNEQETTNKQESFKNMYVPDEELLQYSRDTTARSTPLKWIMKAKQKQTKRLILKG